MQKQRFIPVVLPIALTFYSSGLMYHLLESENASRINNVNSSLKMNLLVKPLRLE